MSTTRKIDNKTGRFCHHTVVFTDKADILCAVRAMQGRSTASIAEELDLTFSQVTYRIIKAQRSIGTRFRSAYRDGTSDMAKRMIRATQQFGITQVQNLVAPKFIPFAANGVSRMRH